MVALPKIILWKSATGI